MTVHQSFYNVQLYHPDRAVVEVHVFDLSASLLTASHQAERDGLEATARRMRADSEFLRDSWKHGLLILTK